MSRVYWTTEHEETAIMGAERAWMDGLTRNIAEGVMHLRSTDRRDRLRGLVSPGHSMASHPLTGPGMSWEMAYLLMFSGDDWGAPIMQYQGKKIDTFELALNTALAVGSDAVKLAARLHGQCEIHAWVDWPHKKWLTEIIDQGLKDGVLRHGVWYQESAGDPDRKWLSTGWENVLALLAEDNDSPVVTSYSVCDTFPEKTDVYTEDEWESLTPEDRWREGMADLRTNGKGLQLTPEHWDDYRFGHKLSLLDIFATDWEDRIRTALDITA